MGSFSMGWIKTDPNIQHTLDSILRNRKDEIITPEDPDVLFACGYDREVAEEQLIVFYQRNGDGRPHSGPDCWIVSEQPFKIKIGGDGR
jgi:hypothetical protein